jgi:hypothetical protein
MSLNDFSNVVSTGDGPALTQVGFGTLLLAVYHTKFADMTRVYEATTDVASDGFSTTSAAYRMVQRAFQQSPRPKSVKLGKLLSAPVTKYRLTPIALDATEYEFTLMIEGRADLEVSITSDGSATVDELCDAIQTAIEAATKGVTQGTSTSSVLVGTGPKTFVTQAGLDLRPGQPIVATSTLGSDTMTGTVTSYSGTSLVIEVASVTGSGTDTDWTFTVDYLTVTPSGGTATYLDLQAANTGGYFWLSGWRHDRIELEETTADPGMVADLDAIRLADADWYGLAVASHSAAAQRKAADWAEAQRCQFFSVTSDTKAMDSGDLTDIASVLGALSYKRTMCYFSLKDTSAFTDVGAPAERFPFDPGTGPDAGGTFDAKTIAGVPVDALTPTQKTNLRTKKYNVYIETAGINHTLDGWTPEGTFGDQIRFEDWFNTRLQEKLFAAKKNVGRLPMSKIGLAALEACVRAQFAEGIASGGIDPGDGTTTNPGPRVTVPTVSDISSNDRAARHVGGGGLQAAYRYTGAINDEDVTVLVTT